MPVEVFQLNAYPAFRRNGCGVHLTPVMRQAGFVRYHAHDVIELALVVEGGAEQCCDGRIERLVEGDVAVVPIGSAHALRGGPIRVLNLHLDQQRTPWPELPPELRQALADVLARPTVIRARDGRLRRLLEQVAEEAGRRRPGWEAALRGLVQAVLVELSRLGSPTVQAVEDGRVERLRQCIAAAPERPLRLVEAALLAGCSSEHLCRLFHRATGMSPAAFRRARRLERVRSLLRGSGMSVAAAARACGWNDPAGFARLFRSVTGQSPSDWRRSAGA
jgi:AraC-like DNA-binding protein